MSPRSAGAPADYNGLKRAWTDTVALLARAAHLPQIGGPVTVRATWYEPDGHRDPDGVVGGGLKLILDGLVVAGVLPTDGPRHVGMSTGVPGVRRAFGPMLFTYHAGAGVDVYLDWSDARGGVETAKLSIPHKLPDLNELFAAREYGARKSVYRRGRNADPALEHLIRTRGLKP